MIQITNFTASSKIAKKYNIKLHKLIIVKS